MAEYLPGKCNIGPICRLVRAVTGATAMTLAFVGLGFMISHGFHPGFRLVLFFPLFLGYLGILQAITGFSAQHAFRGMYDMR